MLEPFAMRVVYDAENVIDAHLVKGLLACEDIPSFVRGEYLTGALGELPVMGLVAVCVADVDFSADDRIVATWRGEAALAPEPGWDAEADPA